MELSGLRKAQGTLKVPGAASGCVKHEAVAAGAAERANADLDVPRERVLDGPVAEHSPQAHAGREGGQHGRHRHILFQRISPSLGAETLGNLR